MASKSAERKEPVTRGTGNVFADLGFPDAAERQAKLRLAYALNQVLEARKLSQADAAKVLGVTQPKVSALRHYKLAGFSVERLMNLLTALDQDIEIVIRRKPRSRKTGRITSGRVHAQSNRAMGHPAGATAVVDVGGAQGTDAVSDSRSGSEIHRPV
jgi:predicted XRE-type DNA-binding protein